MTAKSVPAGDGWLHEPKLDGYRLQVAKQGPSLRLYSRRGYDWSKRLATLAEALKGIPALFAALDAELCFPGPDGAPDFFRLLKAAFHNQGSELAVYAFDLLYLNGQDLRPQPLIERRRHLERLLTRAKVTCLHLVDAFDDGQAQGAVTQPLRTSPASRRTPKLLPAVSASDVPSEQEQTVSQCEGLV
jgi:bifunctional non-homologous end joining protein LigD